MCVCVFLYWKKQIQLNYALFQFDIEIYNKLSIQPASCLLSFSDFSWLIWIQYLRRAYHCNARPHTHSTYPLHNSQVAASMFFIASYKMCFMRERESTLHSFVLYLLVFLFLFAKSLGQPLLVAGQATWPNWIESPPPTAATAANS